MNSMNGQRSASCRKVKWRKEKIIKLTNRENRFYSDELWQRRGNEKGRKCRFVNHIITCSLRKQMMNFIEAMREMQCILSVYVAIHLSFVVVFANFLIPSLTSSSSQSNHLPRLHRSVQNIVRNSDPIP